MKYVLHATDPATGRRRRFTLEANARETVIRKAVDLGLTVEEIRPQDVYDRLVARLWQLLCAPIHGWQRYRLRKDESSRRLRRRAEEWEREATRPIYLPDSGNGTVRVGDQEVPAIAIQAIEPDSTNPLLGPRRYGWIVHLFHRGSLRVMFFTPDNAERYFAYLCQNVPGLQVIRRESQSFWWISV